MAFVLDTTKRPHTGPVEWSIPGDGEPLQLTFNAHFKRLSQEQIKAMLSAIRVAWQIEPETFTEAEQTLEPQSNRELVIRVFVGWDGIDDAKGKPLAFSDATRDEVLSIQGAEVAVLNTWVESITGAATKN